MSKGRARTFTCGAMCQHACLYQGIIPMLPLCSCQPLLGITLSCISMTLLLLLTGGRGDPLCPSPEAPVSWRLLSAVAPLSVPCQD